MPPGTKEEEAENEQSQMAAVTAASVAARPSLCGKDCLCGDKFRRSCHARALRSGLYSFALSYGMRTMLSVLLRIVQLMRSNPRGLFDIKTLVGEKSLIVREEAVRLGLFTGVFVGSFNWLRCFLQSWRGRDPRNSMIAGFFSGLSVLFMVKDTQRTLALYAFARLLQTLYNEGKLRGYYKPIPHGDALLFILSSAQIMYAYVMRPDTLPPSYWQFIVRTGPIDPRVLEAVRSNCRNQPFDTAKITQYLTKASPAGAALPDLSNPLPGIVGCNLLHPQQPACTPNAIRVFSDSYKKVFPLYASLTLVPMFVLRFKAFLRAPHLQILKAGQSAGRSTAFLAAFVALYQAAVCSFRRVSTQDHRFEYFLAGIISSLSIFIEQKSRRAELAMYTGPRAADSLFMLLRDRKLLASVPYGEIILFCMATGCLSYYFHEKEGRSMSGLMNGIFKLHFGRWRPFH